MKLDLSKYDLTIIVSEELHAEIRGYGLKHKEFRLKYAEPQKREATTLDGCVMEDSYYVVDISEYERVTGKTLSGSEVLVPTWAAKISFRPKYMRGKG